VDSDNKGDVSTIAGGVALASAGDIVVVSPGAYNETVTVNKRLTIVGLGGRGAAFIEPSTAGAEGMQVTADDVTLINLGVASDDTGSYALNLNAVSRFRAHGCKFECASGASTICALLDGTATDQVGDALFSDCEFAWAAQGIVADASAYGVPTQIFVEGCKFHNITTAHIAENDADAWFTNLIVSDCVFEGDEAGAEPTDYIVVDHASSSGLFSGNRFAIATNATAKLTIGAQVMWVANATEAGWSTARPA